MSSSGNSNDMNSKKAHWYNCECWDCICGNASVGVGAGDSAFGLIRLGESREDNTGRGWAKGPHLHLAAESSKTISGPPLNANIPPVWEFSGFHCQICGRSCFYVCLSIFTAQNWCRGTSRNPESSRVSGQKLENIMTWLKQTPVSENRMLLRETM